MTIETRRSTSSRHFASCILPVFLLTVLAAVIRFYRLSHPCLWYDESMVFWRTCGTYGQLLDCLRTDGFVPLHYSLIWLITRFCRHTPFMLRLVPALAGTLMVPAVYFFASQLLPRGTALLAAAFTACSAFMLFYSRDAKMYMDAWLFVALNIACLLLWFRTGRLTAWLCWIASGAAACGLQITSAIPVVLSLLLLFTQSRMRWQQMLLWLAGVLLIFAGPVVHYEKFNVWIDQVQEDGWQKSDLQWINAYNYGRSGPELVCFLGTTLVMGWEWPKDGDITRMPVERFDGPAMAVKILLAIFIAGCLPWPAGCRGNASALQTGVLHSGGLRLAEELDESAVTLVAPFPQEAASVGLFDRERQPQWRVFLWLSVLIVLPVYGFYCRSMPHFGGPGDWWNWTKNQTAALSLLALIILPIFGLRLYLALRGQHRRAAIAWLMKELLREVRLVVTIGVMIGLCWLMANIMAGQAKAAADAGRTWESLWVPRYLGFIWPAFATAVAAILMRLPTRAVRVAAIGALLGMNLAAASIRVLCETEPPVDLMAKDWVTAQSNTNRIVFRARMTNGTQAPGGGNLFSGPGEYYIDLYSHASTDPPGFKRDLRNAQNQFHAGFPGHGPIHIAGEINRIIVWDQTFARQGGRDDPRLRQAIPGEDLLKRLPGWKLSEESFYQVRDCWIWQDLMLYRRREFTRR